MVVFSCLAMHWTIFAAAIAWASADTCGAGHGDLRRDEKAFLACRGCHRHMGHLIFREDPGTTDCEDCGDGHGDLRNDESAMAACRKCYSESRLEYNILQVVGHAMRDHQDGFTRCINAREDDSVVLQHRMVELLDARGRHQKLLQAEFKSLQIESEALHAIMMEKFKLQHDVQPFLASHHTVGELPDELQQQMEDIDHRVEEQSLKIDGHESNEERKALHDIIMERDKLQHEVQPFLQQHHTIGELPTEMQEKFEDVHRREEAQRKKLQEHHMRVRSMQMSGAAETQWSKELREIQAKLVKITPAHLRGQAQRSLAESLQKLHKAASKPIKQPAFHSLPHLQAMKSFHGFPAKSFHAGLPPHLQAAKPFHGFPPQKRAEKADETLHQQSGTAELAVPKISVPTPHLGSAPEQAEPEILADGYVAIVLALFVGTTGAASLLFCRMSPRTPWGAHFHGAVDLQTPEPGRPTLLASPLSPLVGMKQWKGLLQERTGAKVSPDSRECNQ